MARKDESMTSDMQNDKFQINLKMLGIYFACLGVLLFCVLVYGNYKTIVAQKSEIYRLTKISEKLEWQKSELGFVRNALIVHEPYYYENILREQWGYRKKGEKLLSELPARHYISKGVPVYTIVTRKKKSENWLGQIVFYLLIGLSISGITFFFLFSVGVKEKEKPDPILQMKKLFFRDRHSTSSDNFND